MGKCCKRSKNACSNFVWATQNFDFKGRQRVYDNVPHSYALPSSLEKYELTFEIGIMCSLCWPLFEASQRITLVY